MTTSELEAIGCKKIHWNPNWNGGYFEYYLTIEGKDGDWHSSRLSVSFGDEPDRPFMAWLKVPGTGIALKHVVTIRQFAEMYALITGRPISDWFPAGISEVLE